MSNLGGYELKKTNPNPEVTLIASGSEVQIAIDALNKLERDQHQFKSSFYALPRIVR